MQPNFPNFKNIEATDRETFYKYTNNYDPYSDFNFTSFYCYDTDNNNKFSFLNDNLVIILRDYMTGKPFLTFLGTNKQRDTITQLLEYSRKNELSEQLKMVPEISLKDVLQDQFTITEDRDNFDYIYLVNDLCELSGANYKKHRKDIKRFLHANPNVEVKPLNLQSQHDQNIVLSLFATWAEQTSKTPNEIEAEKISISRLFDVSNYPEFILLGVFLYNELISFSIDEQVGNSFAIGHFGKFSRKYLGVNQFTEQSGSKILRDLNITHINLEQDLGEEGLRLTKTLLRPVKFLKKYLVS